MSNASGHRWSKFWWRDHQGDAALRMCSLGARGLWMELLCIAHEANPVGHVLINGRQPTARQLCGIVGANEREVTRYLHELEEAGVFSRTSDGTICSRRMCRDAEQSQAGREAISKRWGNKSNQSNGEDPNRSPNRPPNRDPTPDPNTRSLESESEKEPPRNPPANGGVARGAHRPIREVARKPFRSGALELIRREMEERDSAVPWLDTGAIGHVH